MICSDVVLSSDVSSSDVSSDITLDTLLGGAIRLAQLAAGYRVAIDTVLLAASITARPGARLADFGCGVGAASLCVAHRLTDCTIVGFERDGRSAALARQNFAANGMDGRLSIVEGSIADRDVVADGTFDHVFANPPYLSATEGTRPAPARRAANFEGDIDLGQWLDAMVSAVKPKGRVTLVHRADRIDEILAGFAGRVGELAVLPLWPKIGRPAKRVIVSGRRGVLGPAKLLAGIVLHEADGGYTQEADAILCGGAAIAL